MSRDKIQHLREEYRFASLLESEIDIDPFAQFSKWMKTALEEKLPEPNAMALATVDENHRPKVRTVLLKGFSEEGFEFYTNYNSRKGKQLLHNNFASLLFLYHQQERQIRIEGRVEKMSAEDSEAYFQKRPKSSQIGAWASPQSRTISDRKFLEEKVKELEEQYAETEVLPKPPHWGGYRLLPDRFEFWQGRPSRLHDRMEYILQSDGTWIRQRLAP